MNHIKRKLSKHPQTHHILSIVLHFSIIYAFEVITTCSIFTAGRIYDDVRLRASSALQSVILCW